MTKSDSLTADRARALLRYDADTGDLRWKCSRGKVKAGHLAGHLLPIGYHQIMIDRVPYFAHRLVWLIMTGDWPQSEIDHINGARGDNRWINLREASRSQNNANSKRRASNRCGFKGVSFFKPAAKYAATISKDRVRYHLGYFDEPEDAHAAYLKAARDLYGEFSRAL